MDITVEDIMNIHSQAIDMYGGLDGVRDYGAIDSVIQGIYLTFDEEELYPTVVDKASFLAYGLIKNHAFLDGNKRVGVATMLVFLQMNGYNIECTNEQLIDFGLGVAKSELEQPEIAEWIESHHVKPLFYLTKTDPSYSWSS